MSIILKAMKTKSNFSWKFVRLGSRTRSFTMLPAFGAWSLIHLPKKAWRAFYLPALSWPAPATTRSEFGTWILIWAPTPSTGGTFTATYKSTHLIGEISSKRDKSLMSFVFVCLFSWHDAGSTQDLIRRYRFDLLKRPGLGSRWIGW